VCNDGLYCTGPSGDTCQAGVCTGPARTCDDSSQCTLDICDEIANACVHDAPSLDGYDCDDGAYCTVGDLCLSGACVPGAPRDCADSEDCTIDSCNDVSDACVHAAKSDGTACAGGASCTVGETCAAGVCGNGVLDATACADHYLCYKASSTAGTPGFEPVAAVPLADTFEAVATDVRKSTQLCTPASKNGATILDPLAHLEGYLVKTAKGEPKHVPQTGVSVTDEFGTLVVDTLKPRQLLVPSGQALGGAPEPLLSPTLVNHYKCYKVKLSATSPAFPSGVQTSLADEFTGGPKLFDVRKPKVLCVPVDSDGRGVAEPLANLMCYQVKAAKGEPRHEGIEGQIHTINQFGEEQLDTKKEDVLCVPALVNPAP
jgi:hypothetical protein